jgi:hypothetical protein
MTNTPTPASDGEVSDIVIPRRWLLYCAVGIVGVMAVVLVLRFSFGWTFGWNHVVDAAAWLTGHPGAVTLQWLVSLLPGVIIIHHLVYLLSSRRGQFRLALQKPGQEAFLDEQITRLEELYFGAVPLVVRYTLAAVIVTLLNGVIMAALTSPASYLPWLYGPAGAPAAVPPAWPATEWARQSLRGAGLGFLGAYVFVVLLLTDRARQRDVTMGTAIWAGAMSVLGPITGGVAALLLASGVGGGSSFTRDAFLFVAGMLPRQFATFVQAGVRRLMQSGQPDVTRSTPLTTLRGVGTDVAARLEEEGIFNVSSLAYASPFGLIRSTAFAPRQIVDWIDEALLVATLPAHWQALENLGVTGAMDLAWYKSRPPEQLAALAAEVKMALPLLDDVVERLAQDAQVGDLYSLYWDRATGAIRG